MRGHERDRKTEWFSRLRLGAGRKASRRRPSAFDGHTQGERAQLENLEVDTKLKRLQIQAVEDERELLSLKQREHLLNIEMAEIKRGLTLIGIVVLGATMVAAIALDIADPSLGQPGLNLSELWQLLGR